MSPERKTSGKLGDDDGGGGGGGVWVGWGFLQSEAGRELRGERLWYLHGRYEQTSCAVVNGRN